MRQFVPPEFDERQEGERFMSYEFFLLITHNYWINFLLERVLAQVVLNPQVGLICDIRLCLKISLF